MSVDVPFVTLEKRPYRYLWRGIGSPYFSTDTTAALRAAEIEADAILMAKNGVDGVYNADPKKDKRQLAVKLEELTHRDVIIRTPYHGFNSFNSILWITILTW